MLRYTISVACNNLFVLLEFILKVPFEDIFIKE